MFTAWLPAAGTATPHYNFNLHRSAPLTGKGLLTQLSGLVALVNIQIVQLVVLLSWVRVAVKINWKHCFLNLGFRSLNFTIIVFLVSNRVQLEISVLSRIKQILVIVKIKRHTNERQNVTLKYCEFRDKAVCFSVR